MARSVAIVTDSTATIPQHLIEQYHIAVAPQIVIFGEQSFEDGIDIQPAEFYERLKASQVLPTTSQVTPKSLVNIFTELHAQGYEILAILVSELLSGTIASARQALEMVPEARVEIVDSLGVSMALGYQVLAVARAAEEGANLQECKALAEKAKDTTGIILTVDTLEYLHRGGRIGGASRFLGTALNTKPILDLRDGRLEGLERIRTRRKALNRVVELVVQRIGDRKPVRIAGLHAAAPAEAQELTESVQQAVNPVEVVYSEVSPAIGVHCGPGTVGVAYMVGM